MDLWLGFLGGQVLAVVVQWLHWKQPALPWMKYWRNGHLARHLFDAALSVVFLLGWKSGALVGFAGIFGEKAAAWVANLPAVPEANEAAIFVGFVVAIAMRWAHPKIVSWFRGSAGDPPSPNTPATVTP